MAVGAAIMVDPKPFLTALIRKHERSRMKERMFRASYQVMTRASQFDALNAHSHRCSTCRRIYDGTLNRVSRREGPGVLHVFASGQLKAHSGRQVSLRRRPSRRID